MKQETKDKITILGGVVLLIVMISLWSIMIVVFTFTSS